MPLWEQVKGNLVEWYTVAADKTEELAKIGVRRYDKFGISRDIERQFTELGSLVFNRINEGQQELAGDPALLAIVERIRSLEADLQVKEEEIEDIRQDHRQRAAAKTDGARGGEAAKVAAGLADGSAPAAVFPAGETAETAAGEDAAAGDSPGGPEEGKPGEVESGENRAEN